MLSSILSSLVEIDTDLLLMINGWRSSWADCFMFMVSGKWIWVPMYAAILFVIWRNMSWKLALGCVVTVALTITFADQIGASLIRPLVCRLRPSNLENPISDLVQVVNGYRGGRYGFPSCHAANTFGLAFYVYYIFRHRWLTLFIVGWALLNCYSRAYLGVHYPGDLLAGAVVGFIGASICYGLFYRLLHYQRPSSFKYIYWPIIVGGGTIALIAIYAIGEACMM